MPIPVLAGGQWQENAKEHSMNICSIKYPMAAIVWMILSFTSSAWSWDRIGHRVAAKMAEARLSPDALAVVHALLGPGMSLAEISTWADEQREAPGTAPWHYVRVPIKEARYDPRFCPAGGCIVSKIEDFRHVLQDAKADKAEKQRALKYLVHLVADLHQPLNIGDTGCQGGDTIQVRFFNAVSSLHRVWDSQIMERHTENEQVWLWDFDFLANPRMVAEWSKGTTEDWATETLQVAKKAYRLPGTMTAVKSGTQLGDAYCRFALRIIQEQLAKAGIRLACMLNGLTSANSYK
jgi:hypothetical protein